MDAGGEKPVFVTQVEEDGFCTWAISTVVDGRAKSIMSINEDLSESFRGTSLMPGTNGTFWASVDSSYVHFMGDKDARFSPVTKGGSVSSLSSTAAGHAYAIETGRSGKGIWSSYLVDLEERRFVPLAGDQSEGSPLERAPDGNVYVDGRLHGRSCIKYKVEFVGRTGNERLELREAAHCGVSGRDGASWWPRIFGVQRFFRGEITEYYPLEPMDGCIGHGYYPALITADQLGNVWFLRRKLWHIDPLGKLFSTNLPPDSRYASVVGEKNGTWGAEVDGGQLIAASDGTVWLTDGRSLYHFVREP